MRIVTLVENTTHRQDLTPEHGLSLCIETENHKILFDAGQSGPSRTMQKNWASTCQRWIWPCCPMAIMTTAAV